MVIELNEKSFVDNLFSVDEESNLSYKKTTPSILEFYVSWCPHCQAMMPRYDAVSNELDGKIGCYRVELEKHPRIGELFGISGFPTFVFIKPNGEMEASEGEMDIKEFKNLIAEVF